jgi:hypothetical protein
MALTQTDKIIIGSTVIVTASTISLIMLSKKYARAANEVHGELQDIEYLLSKCREDILVGNKDINEGNKLLRSLIKKSLEEQK